MNQFTTKDGYEEIGSVGVDSGTFGILRHADLNFWTARKTGSPLGIAVWGRDKDEIVGGLRELGFTTMHPSFYFVSLQQEADFNLITQFLEDAQKNGRKFVYDIILDNSYDRLRAEPSHFSDLDGSGMRHIFFSQSEFGDGVYGVSRNADVVIVGRIPDNTEYETIVKGNPFVLLQETTFVASDPAFLDEGLFGATLFNLAPGHYEHILIRQRQSKRSAGLGIQKVR